MSLALPLASPIYDGGGVSTEVPGVWDCALNGVGFMVDWKRTYTGVTRFSRQSIPLLKPQQDTTGVVAEHSLNPEEFARRAAESWHHGAGQTYHDRSDSDEFRFRTSKGVDVWTKWGVTLLNDTAVRLASADTNLLLVAAGTRLYVVDGVALRFTTDLSSWTAVTGMPGTPANAAASDGYTVYTAHGASGIYTTDTGTAAASSYNSRAANGVCGYVKGRLIVTNDNLLVNITGAATETILLAHPNSQFRWTCMGEGPGFIYACGYAGDKALIYKTAIQQDALALASPTVAGEMPDGEVIRAIQGYLGFLLVGTDKGLRLLSLDANGNVAASGRVIPTASPVLCLEPQDRFVWYGLSNYDSVSTGLGRADLSEFTDTLTPAYASDLMAATQGTVVSAVTFGGVRVFAVSGVGVYQENTAAKVASGTLDSGLVGYDMPDPKVAMSVDVRFDALVGTVGVALSSDGGGFVALMTDGTAGDTSLVTATGEVAAVTFETRLTLTGSGAASPTVRRWTLEANPAPGRGELFDVPLMLSDFVDTNARKGQRMDVAGVYTALLSMEALGRPVSYQDGWGTQTVFLDDHEFLTEKYTENRDAFQGTFVAHLRRPRARS